MPIGRVGDIFMYAVIKTGGKQYTVKEGDILKIELLPDDVGSEIRFNEVLMLADGEKVTCGTPLLSKAVVTAQVLDHGRHKKVKIIKFRRRKHHMKTQGHRQYYSTVKVTAVSAK